MKAFFSSLPGLMLGAVLIAVPGLLAAEPRVVVTIKPVHSIVANITKGVVVPDLLIEGGQSPHTFHLAPSHVRTLSNADLVIWVGEALESALEKTIDANVNAAKVLELLEHESEAEETGYEKNEHADYHEHQHDEHSLDPHIWLSRDYVDKIIGKVTNRMVLVDPQNGDRYRDNAQSLVKRLDEMDNSISAQLEAVRDVPYLVFHDAYGYFEERYHLGNAGSVTLNAERMPGAKHLKELRHRVEEEGAACVFSEPQFEPRLVNMLVDGTKAKAGVLDPLGAELQAGEDAYFQLMQGLTDAYLDCLSGRRGS